ncbi:MAG: L-histidine N(alpha)-methyltransferase [Acidimicrobiia bacterium]|nr:L-histidine N(alpha)-methyltransferase [Acidimicrobiia bacterium]
MREGRVTAPVLVDAYLTGADLEAALRSDVARGLTSVPKELPPKWFYDARGSQLFDEITRLEEYYPTRREREILEAHAPDVAAFGADTLVELGSGTSEKTRLLLDAMAGAGHLRGFIPFDVDEGTLRNAAEAVAGEYDGIEVHAIVGDFEHHLGRIPVQGRRVVAFLGGTIGNLPPAERGVFLDAVAAGLRAGEAVLLGTDLVKDIDRLEAAYDDAAGVTAEFNRNVLRVVNRRLGADFVPERFTHVARFDKDNEWIEMLLRSDVHQTVHVPSLELTVEFERGEEMRTEISAKFRRAGVETELAAAGLRVVQWWTDSDGDFALSLSVRR